MVEGRIGAFAAADVEGALNVPAAEPEVTEGAFLVPLAVPVDEAEDAGRAIPLAGPAVLAVVDASGARTRLAGAVGAADAVVLDAVDARAVEVVAVATPGRVAVGLEGAVVVRGGTPDTLEAAPAGLTEAADPPVPVPKEAFAAVTVPGRTEGRAPAAVLASAGLTGDAVDVFAGPAAAVPAVPGLRTTGGARALPAGDAATPGFLTELCDGLERVLDVSPDAGVSVVPASCAISDGGAAASTASLLTFDDSGSSSAMTCSDCSASPS